MTIKEIAKLSGVSKSTVSRVINNQAGVSEDARIKVNEVVRKHNFVLNRSASNIKKNKKVYLVLTTRLDSYSETRVIRGLMKRDTKSEFLITETQFSIDRTKEIINNNANVSGIIIFAISGEDYSFINNISIPVVTIGQKDASERYNYYFPDFDSVYNLVKKHTLDKPIFLGYDKNDMTMLNRYKGACSAINKDIEYLECDSFGHINIKKLSTGYNTFICATDSIALIAYKFILRNNISDYKILCVGSNKQLNFIIENLYYVNYHYKDAGNIIMDKLIKHEQFNILSEYEIIN